MKHAISMVSIILMAMLSTCYSHISGGVPYQDVNPQVYCGRSLARALALLCFGEMSYEKRSESSTMYGAMLSPYYVEQEAQLGLPWIPQSRAKSLDSRGKRYSGVVNECCDKPCSINELLNYC